ncbi:MAG: NADH-quinone oxidoreductase subunit NuoG [Alphaproteobacteria bacterium]|nr:NADH-quinone oxidoreductase subunit NuoG [Alphaproteobacteria bacterium]
MPTLTIDDKQITVDDGLTLIQACEIAGVTIPRFCYHETLSVAGNCRMCLVEVETNGRKAPKPQASCALPVAEGMVVQTQSETVKAARAGIMEFLLINHPLDCPICDQGGECDLQDQAMAFGRGVSRFDEQKRAVLDKDMGPLIKTVMTRCIHCTRCVRFSTEIAGVTDMGMINRGEMAEITSLGATVQSELSGNVIDLCPVGALTAKPHAFHARSWELTRVASIDLFDALGSHITFEARDKTVVRVLPRYAPTINGEWIGDKTRFACDGLRHRRIDRPYIRALPATSDQGARAPKSERPLMPEQQWHPAFDAIARHLAANHHQTAIVIGDTVPTEAAFMMVAIADQMDIATIDARADQSQTPSLDTVMFQTPIEQFDALDAVITIGADLKATVPVLNARLRTAWIEHDLLAIHLGDPIETTYPVHNLATDGKALQQLIDRTHPLSSDLLTKQRGAVVLDVETTQAAPELVIAAQELAAAYGFQYNGFTTAASRVGAMMVDALPRRAGVATHALGEAIASGRINTLWLLGVDTLPTSWLDATTVIYHGSHGDHAAAHADIVLPVASWGEQDGVYVNCEGRVQHAHRAVPPPGMAQEEWKVLRALADHLTPPASHHPLHHVPAHRGLPHPVTKVASRNQLLDLMVQEHPSLGQPLIDAMASRADNTDTASDATEASPHGGTIAVTAGNAGNATGFGEQAMPTLSDATVISVASSVPPPAEGSESDEGFEADNDRWARYYRACPISRASPTMQACIDDRKQAQQRRLAGDHDGDHYDAQDTQGIEGAGGKSGTVSPTTPSMMSPIPPSGQQPHANEARP